MMSNLEIHEQIRNVQHEISRLLEAQSYMLTAAGGYHPAIELLDAKRKIELAANNLSSIVLRIG